VNKVSPQRHRDTEARRKGVEPAHWRVVASLDSWSPKRAKPSYLLCVSVPLWFNFLSLRPGSDTNPDPAR
jgi:hypothetical protein